MLSDRLRQIEENLSLLQEQLGGMEKALIRAPEEEKPRIKQRIRDEIRLPMREYEQEYWQLIAENANQFVIPEADAEVAIAEIVEHVTQIEAQPLNPYSEEVLQILRDIRNKLTQPSSSASAKVKGVISTIPPFIGVAYEGELNLEKFFQQNFPTFTKLIRGATNKLRGDTKK